MSISSSAPWLKYYGDTPQHLKYPQKTIYEMVKAAADKYPKNYAYEFMGKKTTYAEFMQKIDAAAKAYLALGIQKGDRVTICMPNCPQAVNRIGAVSNMIHPLSAAGEIKFYLNFSQSKAILTLDQFYPKVEERVLEQFERDIPSDALAAEDGDLSAGGLLPDELSDLLAEALDTLKRFGVSDDAIDGVTKSVTDSAVSAAERAAYLLVKTIVQAALFLAFFLALMLLLRLLTHGLDRLFSLPVLAQLNGLGGAALSLIEGALLIFLIVFLAPRLGVTWFADHAAGTHLLAWFLNNTPRSIIASLT